VLQLVLLRKHVRAEVARAEHANRQERSAERKTEARPPWPSERMIGLDVHGCPPSRLTREPFRHAHHPRRQ
jgi:hypothetical protein